jgi:hypothetical protein
VPTPSAEATSTGSSIPARSGRKSPPKLPISLRTPGVKVAFASFLTSRSAASWASMSTPAAA